MKISTAIMFLILVSGIFAVYGLMVNEANTQYDNSTIPGFVPLDSSNWSGGNGETGGGPYDFILAINGTVGPLQVKFSQITNTDEGFFSKLVAGISAIPYAVILVPDVLFKALVMAGSITTGFLTVLGIPAWFIIMGGVMLMVWGVFKLLEYYQRVPL